VGQRHPQNTLRGLMCVSDISGLGVGWYSDVNRDLAPNAKDSVLEATDPHQA